MSFKWLICIVVVALRFTSIEAVANEPNSAEDYKTFSNMIRAAAWSDEKSLGDIRDDLDLVLAAVKQKLQNDKAYNNNRMLVFTPDGDLIKMIPDSTLYAESKILSVVVFPKSADWQELSDNEVWKDVCASVYSDESVNPRQSSFFRGEWPSIVSADALPKGFGLKGFGDAPENSNSTELKGKHIKLVPIGAASLGKNDNFVIAFRNRKVDASSTVPYGPQWKAAKPLNMVPRYIGFFSFDAIMTTIGTRTEYSTYQDSVFFSSHIVDEIQFHASINWFILGGFRGIDWDGQWAKRIFISGGVNVARLGEAFSLGVGLHVANYLKAGVYWLPSIEQRRNIGLPPLEDYWDFDRFGIGVGLDLKLIQDAF